MENSRRSFLKTLGLITASSAGAITLLESCTTKTTTENLETSQPETTSGLFFKISLAEWSLNKALKAGELTNLDFPAKAKNEFGIDAVEYVNQFFIDKAKDQAYLAELRKRCEDVGVSSQLIMCDLEGEMADLDVKKRLQAVENHYKWVDAAKFLGCHSIRVNCKGAGSREEVAKAGAESLRKLSEYALPIGINVIVENHGEYSSDGQWLSSIIKNVNMQNCGTLPDFGNFCVKKEEQVCVESYDRYKGVEEMIPFAKGVSAKTYDFDEQGNCMETDYLKMLKIVKDAGYSGHIGIEYEGSKLSEPEGVRATKKLLETAGAMV